MGKLYDDLPDSACEYILPEQDFVFNYLYIKRRIL